MTDRYKAIIEDRIEELLPLKSEAADPDVANIEIVSDAAMSFLNVYNLEHLECVMPSEINSQANSNANSGKSNPLNQKWLYIGVQALASIDLKPALVRGEITRLTEPSFETEDRANGFGPDRLEPSQPDETEIHASHGPNDLRHEPPAAPASSSGDIPEDEQASAGDEDWPPVKTPRPRKRRSSGPPVANGKDPWGDEEIKKLIKWKAQGMTHKEVGVSPPIPLPLDIDLITFPLTYVQSCRPGSGGLSPRAPFGTPSF